jgi:hypothetical protein
MKRVQAKTKGGAPPGKAATPKKSDTPGKSAP